MLFQANLAVFSYYIHSIAFSTKKSMIIDIKGLFWTATQRLNFFLYPLLLFLLSRKEQNFMHIKTWQCWRFKAFFQGKYVIRRLLRGGGQKKILLSENILWSFCNYNSFLRHINLTQHCIFSTKNALYAKHKKCH